MVEKSDIYQRICHPGIERAVLHHLIRKPSLLITAKPELNYDKFLSPSARETFICLETLYAKGVETFDSNTIKNEAINHPNLSFLSSPDGSQYITAVFDTIVQDESFDYHYGELIERSRKARLAFAAEDLIEEVINNSSSVRGKKTFQDLMSSYESKVFSLATDVKTEDKPVDFGVYVEEVYQEILSDAVETLGPKTGFKCLDAMLCGLQPGELYILAARYKTGKSSLLCNWARHLAYEENVPVLYIDTEMSSKSQMMRLLSQLTQIKELDLKRRSYERTPENLEKIALAKEIIRSGNFQHRYYPRFSPEGLRFEIRKFVKQFGNKGVVIFDYIKPAEEGNSQFETQQLGYLTTELKNLCGELQIPAVAAVQFNREATKRNEPSSADISASDRIAMFGSVMMALTRTSASERAFLRGIYGPDCDINMKLYVLDARNVSSFSEAIYLSVDLERLTYRESIYQPALDGTLDSLKSSSNEDK